MKKLWVFGDSYSAGLGLEKYFQSEWRKRYIDWKGYVPKTYLDYLSEDFEVEIQNYSGDGQSNYEIFQNFCDVVSDIKPNDLIIFNWTDVGRYRLVNDADSWQTISTWNVLYEKKVSNITSVSFDSMLEIYINRVSNLSHICGEVNSWISFINYHLTKCKVLHWTPFNEPDLYKALNMTHISTINDETNGFVTDSHYGEIGQLQLYNELKTQFNNYKKII
jgi:hypothetical protein